MFDARFFSDTYDLYRPTVATADSGVQTVTEPDTATTSDVACRFFDGPLPGFVADRAGIDQDYDASMVIPASQTLKPTVRGDQPDHVEVDGRNWIVLAVWDAAGRGLYKTALLKERR